MNEQMHPVASEEEILPQATELITEEIPQPELSQMEPLEPLLTEQADAQAAPEAEEEPLPETIPEYIPQWAEGAAPAVEAQPAPAPVKLPQPPKKPLRKRVPLGARIPLQMLSFLLCIALVGSLLAFALLADLRQLVSENGVNAENLKVIINAVMSLEIPDSEPAAWHGGQVDLLAAEDPTEDGKKDLPLVYDEEGNIVGIHDKEGNYIELPSNVFFLEKVEGAVEIGNRPQDGAALYLVPIFDESLNITGLKTTDGGQIDAKVDLSPVLGPDFVLPPDFQLPDNIQLPSDLTDTEAVIDWAMDLVKQILGENAQVSRESISVFVKESTVMDYFAGKMADAATQILTTGQLRDLISTEEILGLVTENKALIQEQFGVEVTEEQLQQISISVDKAITESNLNQILSDKVQETLNSPEMSIMGISVQMILDIVVTLATNQVFYTMVGILVAVCLLLMLTNFYNLPAALTWISIPCILVGGLLSALNAVAGLPILAGSQTLLQTLFALFTPMHNGILIAGIVLLVASILWRILRSVVYHNRCKAAAMAA